MAVLRLYLVGLDPGTVLLVKELCKSPVKAVLWQCAVPGMTMYRTLTIAGTPYYRMAVLWLWVGYSRYLCTTYCQVPILPVWLY
jgi:hypothetical protein